MAEEREVVQFLKHLKEVISIWDVYFLDSRSKNSLQELADLGITATGRKDIILELETQDYSQGPLPETQYQGKEMWIFGKTVREAELYIKLTIIERTNKALCISFHKAAHPMTFPFKPK